MKLSTWVTFTLGIFLAYKLTPGDGWLASFVVWSLAFVVWLAVTAYAIGAKVVSVRRAKKASH